MASPAYPMYHFYQGIGQNLEKIENGKMRNWQENWQGDQGKRIDKEISNFCAERTNFTRKKFKWVHYEKMNSLKNMFTYFLI